MLLLFTAISSVWGLPVVIDNGPPAGAVFGLGPGPIEADEFTLTSTQTITDGIVWVWEAAGITPAIPVPSGIDWTIYADARGIPGATLLRGESPETLIPFNTQELTGLGYLAIGLGVPYEVDFSFGTVTLNAGTYWLGLTEPNASSTGSGIFGNGTLGSGCCDFSGTWQDRQSFFEGRTFGNGLAFQLLYNNAAGGSVSTTPEPFTAGFVALGLLAVVSLRRVLLS